MYVRELAVQYRRRWIETSVPIGTTVRSPGDAAQILGPLLAEEAVEVCGLLCLSTKHQLLAFHEVSRGTLDMTVVHPRDICRAAILTNAAAIVIAHNHPSGDPTPSREDLALCQRLVSTAAVIGIDLLDFLIVGDERYYSFTEAWTSPLAHTDCTTVPFA